jgi:hypothetical protein
MIRRVLHEHFGQRRMPGRPPPGTDLTYMNGCVTVQDMHHGTTHGRGEH